MNKEKPPIGLKPKRFHDKERINEISEAMVRYLTVNKEIPFEWVEEYNQLIKHYEMD